MFRFQMTEAAATIVFDIFDEALNGPKGAERAANPAWAKKRFAMSQYMEWYQKNGVEGNVTYKTADERVAREVRNALTRNGQTFVEA